MKSIAFIFALTLGVLIGCKSEEKATKKDKEVAANEDKKAKDEELKKLEQEKAKKEEEERLAKQELDKKKANLVQQQQELASVRENLKKMGLAAVFVYITKSGDTFTYQDGHTVMIKEKVADGFVQQSLDQIVQKQLEKENAARDSYNTCSNGFEACLDHKLYINFMSRDEKGNCVRQWYLTTVEYKQ